LRADMELVIFAVAAFLLGAIVIRSRDRIPEHMRRPLAVFAVFLIAAAFIMVVARFFFM